MQVDPAVALPCDRRPDDIDQAHDLAALALDLPDGESGVGGLARLADRHIERVGFDHRIAVAEFRRRLGIRRDPGQLFDQLCADLAYVVSGATAEDLDPPEAPQVAGPKVQPVQPGGPESLV